MFLMYVWFDLYYQRWDRSQNATSVANQDILRRNVGLPQRTEVAVGRVLEVSEDPFYFMIV